MGDDHVSSYQSRDRHPFTQSESRIPIPKARRATGESVNRPNHGQSKLGSTGSSSPSKIASAPSTPRPIPKSNKKTLQPSSMSSSYTFDDSIDNPFLPSTPPTFTPSMERTGLIKAESSKEGSSSSVEISKQSTTRKPVTPNTPASATIADEKPPNPSFTRSRDGSVSSLPGPRHEDMILPAVARRIKEKGLFDHDVIAYSDDYNAPLYKLPSASSNINNPFASYDREKAVSSTSLAQQKSPSSISKGRNEAESHSESFSPTLSPSSDIPDSPNASSRQTGAPKSETQSRQQQPSEGRSGANGRDDVPTSNNTPDVAQPERPRRVRRNTNHQTQQEQAISNDEYIPRRQRRPTMPECHDYEDVLGSSNRSQFANQLSPKQHQGQQLDANQGKESDHYQQQAGNDSRELQIANEPRRNESAKINNNSNNNNNSEYHQNSSSQVGGNNRGYDVHTQRQGRYQQNNGDYDRSYQENHGRQRDAYNGHQGEYDSHQANVYAQNGSYAHQSNGGRYDDRQGWHNAQQGDYNAQQGNYGARHGGYNTQQGGYNAQHDNHKAQQSALDATRSNYNNGYNGRNASLPAHDEMAQVEMSEIAPGIGGDVTKVDPKDNMKKKGAVCCVIM
ncbi:hypothetical protein BGX26_002030 [Mortierella sp. AD094]|nr:hypothetical protein BGX26_002030 [Mortierella sp. AD094]